MALRHKQTVKQHRLPPHCKRNCVHCGRNWEIVYYKKRGYKISCYWL